MSNNRGSRRSYTSRYATAREGSAASDVCACDGLRVYTKAQDVVYMKGRLTHSGLTHPDREPPAKDTRKEDTAKGHNAKKESEGKDAFGRTASNESLHWY